MNKRITFLMPRPGNIPAGGYKVVFEYANRLVADGCTVNIIYPCGINNKILAWVKFLNFLIRKNYTAKPWFKLNVKVNEILSPTLAEKYIPKSDIIFATGWKTAENLTKYKKVKNNCKFYFIQGYENWNNPKDEPRLLKTWQSNLRKIVISPWLQKIAIDMKEKTVLIENGLDFKYFTLTKPCDKRNPYCITMMYHPNKLKGFNMAWRSIQIVQKKYPKLQVNIFGAQKLPQKFPKWVTYYQRPSRTQHNILYNQAAIFIATSRMEGFGLTPAEAMQCGCAVACTDIGGYRMFCQSEKTALVSPVDDPEALAKNIIRLIEDKKLRVALAKNGNACVQWFTWERAYSKLKKLITSC